MLSVFSRHVMGRPYLLVKMPYGILNQPRQEIHPRSDFSLHSNTYRVIVAKPEERGSIGRFRGM
jgi:hypothetical protein